MANALNDKLKDELFTLIKHRLGAPIRKIELDNDQMYAEILLESPIPRILLLLSQ